MAVPVTKKEVAAFKTTPYGKRLYSGPVQTFFRNEVRARGAVFRVVEVTMRGCPGEETVLCEYVKPTEYPSIELAIRAAIDDRLDYLKSAAEVSAFAEEIANAEEQMFMREVNPAVVRMGL
jgi:hypothetical protein